MPNLSIKSQGAVEYLITHAWAILIIVIVIAVLATLGLFSANNQPTIPPGSCQVQRPYGVNTTQQLSLIGACRNGLPEFVAELGPTSYINTSIGFVPGWGGGFSDSAWFYLDTLPPGSYYSAVTNIGASGEPGFAIDVDSSGDLLALYATSPCNIFGASISCNWQTVYVDNVVKTGQWYFVEQNVSFSGRTESVCIGASGSALTCNSINLGGSTTLFSGNAQGLLYQIGNDTFSDNFNGMISNVQYYDRSLSSNEINDIYGSGIGGVPIDIYHLIGWWPLNGNANDYSGNQYNGNAIGGVRYTAGWINSYTRP